MKQIEQSMPTANIAINKSRIKVYKKNGDMPIYYLAKSSEFQIELFNPTTDIILAKIYLNGKSISQGGLVLKPGRRVFLERYIDVAKKFKFDTYNVSNTSEVKEAIKNNGDFYVEFYKETTFYVNQSQISHYWDKTTSPFYGNPMFNQSFNSNPTHTLGLLSNTTTSNATTLNNSKHKSKSIETGRVEMGNTSNQKLTTVDYEFESYPIKTVKYKLLPISQKINTIKDIMVAKYCTECGSKQKKNNKFCPNCGTKL